MITKKQFMEEMILNIIKQEYAIIYRYENSLPIPSSDNWIYNRIEEIVNQLFAFESTEEKR